MKSKNYSLIERIRSSNIDHSVDLIKSKIRYEMNKQNYIGPTTEQEYISYCLFAFTVSTSQSRAWVPLYKAQEDTRRRFSALYASQLRLWGMRSAKLNKRNNFLQPFVMTFFDVEGSRHTNSVSGATMPHYHGIILLHHNTVDEFLGHLKRNENDGSYSKSKPTRDFSSIYLQPLSSYDNARRFLDYSTKFSAIITDNIRSHSPSYIYPEKSKYFPFYEHIAKS